MHKLHRFGFMIDSWFNVLVNSGACSPLGDAYPYFNLVSLSYLPCCKNDAIAIRARFQDTRITSG